MIKLTGMVKNTMTKQQQFLNVTQHMIQDIDERINQIRDNHWFKEVDWESVRDINNVSQYKEHIYTLKMNIESQ